MTNQSCAYQSALQWYLDHGVDEVLEDTPVDKFALQVVSQGLSDRPKPGASSHTSPLSPSSLPMSSTSIKNAVEEAKDCAARAQNLDDLKAAIAAYDGLTLKKTATNLVFADGNPSARLMVIGDVPNADDDRQGVPFSGENGALLDKILACINVARGHEDVNQSAYMTNVLNWRPPGNRSPTPLEIETSLPFIERHIALVKPKLLILCGTMTARTLLGKNESLSKLRGKLHQYSSITQPAKEEGIPAMVTYHPALLLSTPAHKRAVWQDMLQAQETLINL